MATRSFRFLTMPQVLRLHQKYIAPALPTQPDMLESAIHSPMNLKHYAKQEDVYQLAANLSEKIMKNHAFMDGNKRTALAATDMFLKINGHYLQRVPSADDLDNKSIADAQVAVVTNRQSAEQLGEYYKSIAKPLDELTAKSIQSRDSEY